MFRLWEEVKMRFVLLLVCLLAVGGCAGDGTDTGPVSLELRIVEEAPGEGLAAMTMSAWGRSETFYAHSEVLMTGDDVASAAITEWQGHPAVEMKFTEAGGERLAQITGGNVGKRMGMIVDGKLMAAPVIRAQISGGVAVINGEFTDEEARRVAAGLGR
jgi:preprotein translocase subunit SecD